MAVDFDVVIIGSGFGGAVSAFRLAKAGAKVLVLERGRRWNPTNFPRQPTDPWIWDDRRVEQCHGWFDFRVFNEHERRAGRRRRRRVARLREHLHRREGRHVSRRLAARDHFRRRCRTSTRKSTHMLESAARADGTMARANQAAAEAADNRAGYGNKFRRLDLAVQFDEDWHYDLPDPHNHCAQQGTHVNVVGVKQGTCVHLGNCDIGCDVNARNTLDLNYLKGAEDAGAEIRPYHIARNDHADRGRLRNRLSTRSSKDRRPALRPGTVSGKIVMVAAGSLGSTELLLRSRDAGALPNVSSRLGLGLEQQRRLPDARDCTPSGVRRSIRRTAPRSPRRSICSVGEFQDQPIFIEDGGLPDIARAWLQELATETAKPIHEGAPHQDAAARF